MSRPFADRIAGAPISWGVCEVPGWGYQMPADQVLRQMSEVGLRATELGPDGFLPADPVGLANTLAEHDLQRRRRLHPVRPPPPRCRPDDRARPAAARVHGGPGAVVLPPDSGLSGYDSRPELDDDGWQRLLRNLDRVAHRAAEHGVRAVLHPHVGTMVETGETCSASSTARTSPCAWTPATCSSAAPTPPSWPGRCPTGSRTRTSRTSTSPTPARSGRAVSPTPRPSGRACTGRWGGRRRRRGHRRAPARTRLRRLVHPRAGHHPHRAARRRDEGPLADVRTSVAHLRAVAGMS